MRKQMLLLGLLIAVGISGCAKRYEAVAVLPSAVGAEETVVEVTTASETEPETESEPDERIQVNGKIRSYLTGEMMDAAKADRRPLAIMMSNDKQALPQYGINRAGVVYEAPVEGDMNRYMAILEDYDDLDRIGPVRSCRTYYTYFAREFGAIYAHYGQSTFALPYLKKMEHINGVDGTGGAAFYRTKDRKSPHNAYASFRGVQKTIEKMGISQEYDPGYEGHYQFAKRGKPVTLDQGQDAYKVIPGYEMNKPWFEYSEEDGLYYRYQYGGPHKGSEGQIAVKNIIIQFCQTGHYANTEYLNINVQTSEDGYYITNGKAIPVRWEKDSEYGPTRYYDADHNEIVLNQGKTWVCIIPTSRFSKAKIHGKE